MTKLSVNVNKLATLRNSRGKNNPDVLKTTLDMITYGAQGITVHPRPDGRHIRREDVFAISKAINVEFNIEGYPDKTFLELVKAIKPTQCTLVPDPPHVLTSNAGWEIEKNKGFLYDIVHILHQNGIRTSLFIDPMRISPKELDALADIKTDRIELYTEAYAEAFGTDKLAEVLNIYQDVATEITELGIGINAGHDLDLRNLSHFVQTIPNIVEVSIGHALICDALQSGLRDTIIKYLACLKKDNLAL
jgi:pyridoxine 5-phosphate synthase